MLIMNKGAYIVATSLVSFFFLGLALFGFQVYDMPMYGLLFDDCNVSVYENVAYGDRERNVVDIYIPATVNKKSEYGLILFIHGGSWTSGDKSSMDESCRLFAAKGYVTASMNYSFLGKSDKEFVDFNTMLMEIASALSAVKEFAAIQGANISKAALSGYSAGAHLAMLFTYAMSDKSPVPILFVESKAGPADYRTFSFSSPEVQDIFSKFGITEEKDSSKLVQDENLVSMLQSVSPVFYVKKGAAPALLSYGKKDILVTWKNVESLLKAYEENGIEYVLVEYPNSTHALENDSLSAERSVKELARFAEYYFGY